MTLAALSPVLAALAGCDTGSDGADGSSGGGSGPIDELPWAIAARPRSLDLARNYNADSMTAIYLIAEPLVSYSTKLELVPIVASKVETPNARTYVYTLRDGVRFHDGSRMTPEDVIFSIKHAAGEDSELSYYFGLLDKIEQTGERQITITTSEPSVVFRYSLAVAPIVPKAFATEKGKQLGAPGGVNLIGTGPFKLETFDQTSLVVVRNDDYWGDKPAVRKVAFSYLEDPESVQLSVRSGEIDGTFGVEPTDAARFEEIPNAELTTVRGLDLWFLAFNVEVEPWSDVHARRAFAYACDIAGVAKSVLGGAAEPATVLVPPNEWAGLLTDDEVTELYKSTAQYPFDLDRARAELAQSATPDGFRATVQVPNSEQDAVDALLVFRGDLAKIGIDLEVKNVPNQTWLDDAFSHEDLSLTFMQWGPDYPDASNYLSINLDGAGAVANGYNLAHYKNPRVDRLLAEQNSTTRAEQRAKALMEVLRISQEDLPYLPLLWTDRAVVLAKEYVMSEFGPLTSAFTPWAGEVARAS